MSYRTRVRYLQKYGTIDYYTKEPELDICKNMAQSTTIQNKDMSMYVLKNQC